MAKNKKRQLKPSAEPRHCDDYIDDETQPLCLRRFLRYHRWPAIYKIRAERLGVKEPELYADFIVWRKRNAKPVRVKVMMASRMGDIGISQNLRDEHYQQRLYVEDLSNFSERP